MQVRTSTCHVTRSPFHVDVIILDNPTLLISVHTTCMPPSYEKVNKREICILLTQLKELQRKRATYRFPPWNQLHLCRNCSQGNEKSSFSYSFAYIVGQFSILLITKYCTDLNALNPTSNSLHRKFTSTSLDFTSNSISDSFLNELSASGSLYWKQSKWDQQKFILIFLLKLCLLFCFKV